MSKKTPIAVTVGLILLCCALTFVITYCEFEKVSPTLSGYKSQVSQKDATIEEYKTTVDGLNSKLDEVSKYFELKDIIDNYYVGDYDQQELEDMMAAGVVAGIGDKWSYYLSAEGYEDYKLANENVYKGIGITISADDETEGYKIVRVAEDGPARDAGFAVGDVLVAVDGTDIIGMDIDKVKSMVQGKDGTEVTITVIRDGQTMDITTVRGTASYEIVKYDMLEDNIGYIKIYNFEGNSYDSFFAALGALQNKGAEAIIFDVRNDPGGLMDQLLKIVDALLPEGETFIQKSVSGQSVTYTSDKSFLDMPMTVLVNENSYSAAEYFAAILQEYGVATIVGTKTSGKGYYQTPLQMSDGSAVVLSVGEYFTPSGRSLAETGVIPDYEVEISDEKNAQLYYDQLDYDDDEQLSQALMLTKTALDAR